MFIVTVYTNAKFYLRDAHWASEPGDATLFDTVDDANLAVSKVKKFWGPAVRKNYKIIEAVKAN